MHPHATTNCSCEVCGKAFYAFPSRIRAGTVHYCSRACKAVALGNQLRRDPVDRFWEHVNKNGPTIRADLGPCWIWTTVEKSSKRTYGSIVVRAKPRLVVSTHRFSWELHYGPIPESLCVLHKCDNPPCVNPDHLFLGDHRDNALDMFSKGRYPDTANYPYGERQHLAKLREADVRDIRSRHASGERPASIHRDYKFVSYSVVQSVIRRVTWKHVH